MPGASGNGPERLPTGTVSFLFTDIVGSTPLWDSHPAEMREALVRHDEILRKAVLAADGHLFSTGGDGFGAVFSRGGNAVAAAVDAQLALLGEPWPEPVDLRVRMGVHTGEAHERDGDYFGPPVNLAARLMGAANGGQVVVSALTAGLLDPSVGVELVDLGSARLKGVVEPVAVFGVAAPGLEWLDEPLISAQTNPGNLPRPQTEFVGDLADLQRRVANLSANRLVTLTGSGGVGKTRAAIEVGWLVIDEFVDGVWFVELASIADPDAVDAAIAATLGARPQPGMSLTESIVDWCLGRRMLLIADNCEHVLQPVLDLVAAIAASCPTVTTLATSREPLGVPGEQVVRIPSLAPMFGEELFMMRAAAADSSFAPSPAQQEAISAICARVDGIPLAIELAAARIRSLSPVELLERLDDRFRLLRGGGRGGLERHQTLRAAVTWSYQLLPEEHQLLFDRLSVFAGGFDLRAAEAVCAGGDIDEYDVIDLIGELVDKSMVVADRGESGTRYRLLETLRQYGEERLDDRGGTSTMRSAHTAYFADFVGQIYHTWCGPQQRLAEAAYEAEWDNLRAAHAWAVSMDDPVRADVIVALTSGHSVWRLRHDHEDWARRSLEIDGAGNRYRSTVLGILATWSNLHGDSVASEEFATRGMEAAIDEESLGYCTVTALYALASAGRIEECAQYVPRIRSLMEGAGPIALRQVAAQAMVDASLGADEAAEAVDWYVRLSEQMGEIQIARSWMVRANLLVNGTDPPDLDGGIAAARTAIELADEVGASEAGTWARIVLAGALTRRRDPGAHEAVRAAVSGSFDVRYVMAVATAIEMCAQYLASAADTEGASVLLGHVDVGAPPWTLGPGLRAGLVSAVTGTENLDELKAVGAAMDRRRAVEYALERLDTAD
jgi:predicted ATPase/class 3 adenylate cyclase